MLNRISSRELAEWWEYYQLEPFGEERADLRNGIVAATIANVNRGKGKRAKKPQDFMPKFEKKQEEQTWQQQLHIVEMLNAAYGGVDKRGKRGDDSQPSG